MRIVLAAAILSAAVQAGVSGRPPAEQAGKGVISGRVIDAATGRPLEGALVTITIRQAADLVGQQLRETPSSGEFRFADLPAGGYELSVTRLRYLSFNHGQKRVGGPGVPIALEQGQRVEGLTLAMPLAGVIAGMVTDERGEPALGVSVRALRLRWIAGRRVATQAGTTVVDDRGWYRIPLLAPGEYVVSCAQAPNLRTKESVAPIYYPGTPEPIRAQEVALGLSEERTGIDFRLQRITLARVSGNLAFADGRPAPNVRVNMADVDRPPVAFEGGTYSTREGDFTISNVPPGRYQVLAQVAVATGPTSYLIHHWASMELAIDGRAVADIRLILQPGLNVAGRVATDRLRKSPAGPFRLTLARPYAEGGMTLPLYETQADGRFLLEGIPPGSYRLSFAQLPAGSYVGSIAVGGRDATGLPLEVTADRPVTDLTITLTDRPSTVTGRLSDADSRPGAGFFVIAFPDDEKYWIAGSSRILVTRTSTDGQYILRGLPAGSYRVALLDDADPDEWSAPPFLKRLLAASSAITLADGEQRTLDLRIK